MSPGISASLADCLNQAERIAVLTGAGVSADSGVPTFRDAQTGLWAKFDPQELATAAAFQAHPQRVWEWYAWRRKQIAAVEANAGHEALAAMESACRQFTLITQNVDGLHRRAGSKRVLEFHGNVNVNRCFDEGRELDDNELLPGTPPRCGHCNGLVRPGVVWFGEAIDERVLEVSFEAAEQCDVFISAGTAAEVYPAAGLLEMARSGGATVIEVNPAATPLSSLAHHTIRERGAVALPALAAALTPGNKHG